MYIFDLLMIECSAGSLTMCNIEFIYNTQGLWENHTTEALLSILILYIFAFLTIESSAVLFYNVYYWIDIQYSRYMGKSHPRCTLVNPDHAYFRLFNDWMFCRPFFWFSNDWIFCRFLLTMCNIDLIYNAQGLWKKKHPRSTLVNPDYTYFLFSNDWMICRFF